MRVLAAHPSRRFLTLLQNCLEPEFTVKCCWDGQSVLEELDRFRPDALILHPCLPGKDGLTVLEETPYRPGVILLMTELWDYRLALRFQELGITMQLLMPSLHTLATILARQLEEQSGLLAGTPFCGILRSLGFRPSLGGYRQICLAAELLKQDPNRMICQEVYPAVARTLGMTSGSAVERSMRQAIHTAWKEGDPLVWRRYFPNGRCPGNKNFLLTLLQQDGNGILEEHTL